LTYKDRNLLSYNRFEINVLPNSGWLMFIADVVGVARSQA